MLLGIHPQEVNRDFAYRTLTSTAALPRALRLPQRFLTLAITAATIQKVPQPRTRNACRLSHAHGLASSAFAHHYSRNHYCFLFLRVLRCFTSPRYHQPPYTFRRRQHPMTGARFPHSEIPGSKSGCRLPGAYRSLPRPSSAPDAKASTVCPKKLGHKRCSRPLCNSQTTNSNHIHTHHQTPTPRQRAHEPMWQESRSRKRGQRHPPPTRDSEQATRPPPNGGSPKRSVSSGPNSVSNPPEPPETVVPTPVPRRGQAVPTDPSEPGHPSSQCSTNELPRRRHSLSDHGVDHAASRCAARCSLERR